MLTPFHLAIPVHDLAEARHFYGTLLGLEEGRSSSDWIDYNLFGHQLVVHLDKSRPPGSTSDQTSNHVDGQHVPVPHFGVVLPMKEWETFSTHILATIPSKHIKIEPTIRFRGQPGEQGTLFFTDPSGNALEFKGFVDIEHALFNKSGQY
jgi:extradiol dioxygenase family protein